MRTITAKFLCMKVCKDIYEITKSIGIVSKWQQLEIKRKRFVILNTPSS